MPLIFIDRRKAGKGKSTPNRQKLIKRVRGFVKTATPQAIGASGVGNTGSRNQNNPVKVAAKALDEPFFAYSRGGDLVTVVIGNDHYDRGDEIKMPAEDEDGGGGGGPGDNGEDEFIVNVASDEFLDLFFEDCTLPNLEHEKLTEKLDNKFQQAGFSTSGNPAQLSIIRTYKQALGRRRALQAPHLSEAEQLEHEYSALIEEAGNSECSESCKKEIDCRLEEIEQRLEVLHRKIAAVHGFDKVDLRFKKREAKPLHTVDAVLIMIMDISGSMDQNKKTIARRWFALLYSFIKRRYAATELVFIAHTEEAMEMSENDFFSTRVNGGTMVSPALDMANKIINERYDSSQTNIYISHASDGDNWQSDDAAVVDQMMGAGKLINKLQFFSYVEVGSGPGLQYYTFAGVSDSIHTNLWEMYEKVRDKYPKKIAMSIIEGPDDCYDVFRKTFKKK